MWQLTERILYCVKKWSKETHVIQTRFDRTQIRQSGKNEDQDEASDIKETNT